MACLINWWTLRVDSNWDFQLHFVVFSIHVKQVATIWDEHKRPLTWYEFNSNRCPFAPIYGKYRLNTCTCLWWKSWIAIGRKYWISVNCDCQYERSEFQRYIVCIEYWFYIQRGSEIYKTVMTEMRVLHASMHS